MERERRLIITPDKLTISRASLSAAYLAPNVSKELLTSLKLAECSAPALRSASRVCSRRLGSRLIKQLRDGSLEILRHVSGRRRQPCQIKAINQIRRPETEAQ